MLWEEIQTREGVGAEKEGSRTEESRTLAAVAPMVSVSTGQTWYFHGPEVRRFNGGVGRRGKIDEEASKGTLDGTLDKHQLFHLGLFDCLSSEPISVHFVSGCSREMIRNSELVQGGLVSELARISRSARSARSAGIQSEAPPPPLAEQGGKPHVDVPPPHEGVTVETCRQDHV